MANIRVRVFAGAASVGAGVLVVRARGVVRIPSGTAHALGSRAFPIAVMGKTGTTNDNY